MTKSKNMHLGETIYSVIYTKSVNDATSVLNRTPLIRWIDCITVFDKLYSQLPVCLHLCVFRCLCSTHALYPLYHNSTKKKKICHKLESRSMKCTLHDYDDWKGKVVVH